MRFLFLSSNSGLNVSISFDSPGRSGEPVNMTCVWDLKLATLKTVTWYRIANELGEQERMMSSSGNLLARDQPVNLPLTKIMSVETDFTSSHAVQLLDVSDADEGEYRCAVNVSHLTEHFSHTQELTVLGKLISNYCVAETLHIGDHPHIMSR